MTTPQQNSLCRNVMRVFTYKIQGDCGAAPCVENTLWSLAICKPVIRKIAVIGDIIIGISGNKLKIGKNKIIFIAEITNVLTIRNYAINHSERSDCIYTENLQLIPNKFHNCGSVKTDLGGKNVLLSTNFIYYGNKYISVPEDLSEIIPGRGHQSDKNKPYIENIVNFFIKEKSRIGIGKIGEYNSKVSPCERP